MPLKVGGVVSADNRSWYTKGATPIVYSGFEYTMGGAPFVYLCIIVSTIGHSFEQKSAVPGQRAPHMVGLVETVGEKEEKSGYHPARHPPGRNWSCYLLVTLTSFSPALTAPRVGTTAE